MTNIYDSNTKDVHGETAPIDIVGRKFKHAKRSQVYEAIGYCWMGDTDEWGVLHSHIDAVVYCRSARNFLGEIEPGVKRFVEVE